MIWNVAEKTIELPRISFGNPTLSGGGESVPGNDHAVIELGNCRRTRNEAGCGIDGHSVGRVVSRGVENNHVSPQSVIGNDNGVAKTIGEGEIALDLPGILRVALPHVGTEDGVSAVTNFGVSVEQA